MSHKSTLQYNQTLTRYVFECIYAKTYIKMLVPSGPQTPLMWGFCFYRISDFMPCYVYIIQSQVDNSYYKGFTENLATRLLQHNNGDSQYTSAKLPWKLVYVEELPTKREALIREKVLKKYSHFLMPFPISTCSYIYFSSDQWISSQLVFLGLHPTTCSHAQDRQR